jgi:hypothetical protein
MKQKLPHIKAIIAADKLNKYVERDSRFPWLRFGCYKFQAVHNPIHFPDADRSHLG